MAESSVAHQIDKFIGNCANLGVCECACACACGCNCQLAEGKAAKEKAERGNLEKIGEEKPLKGKRKWHPRQTCEIKFPPRVCDCVAVCVCVCERAKEQKYLTSSFWFAPMGVAANNPFSSFRFLLPRRNICEHVCVLNRSFKQTRNCWRWWQRRVFRGPKDIQTGCVANSMTLISNVVRMRNSSATSSSIYS